MKICAFVTTFALVLASSSLALADINGRTGNSTTGCGTCHGAMNAATTVRIDGPASVVVGSMNTYQLIITNANATQTAAGLDVSASGGTLGTSAMAPLTRVSRGEVTHRSPIAPNARGMWSIPFTWTAPMTAGTVRIAGAGNAVNANNRNSGDQWNTATLSVTVTSTMMADSGVPVQDSGVPVQDSGVPAQDSGVPVEDMGVPVDDAAVSPQDSGGAPSDSGSSSDSGSATDAGPNGMQMPGCGCSATPTAVDPRSLALALTALATIASRARRKR